MRHLKSFVADSGFWGFQAVPEPRKFPERASTGRQTGGCFGMN
jgi:hypothetical protein